MRKKLIIHGSWILLLAIIIGGIDYVGKAEHKKRYEQYKTEPVTIQSILESVVLWKSNIYKLSPKSSDESFQISFRKEWIPIDSEHDIEINQVIKTVGDTTIIIEKAFRSENSEDDEVTMMVKLQQDTKTLGGEFLLDGIVSEFGVSQPRVSLKFYHQNEPVEVENYGYGTGDSITVSLPIDILEKYQYQIDVIFNGLILYEYEYTGY